MATKWRDIRRTHSPEVEAEIARRVKEAAGVMTLYQLREARSLTQVNLAKVLNVNQGAVSRMEKRTDMYVSTLRNFIQAMGGQLQVKAVFPKARSRSTSSRVSLSPRGGIPCSPNLAARLRKQERVWERRPPFLTMCIKERESG